LVIQLGNLDIALEIAKQGDQNEQKWKQLGDLALSFGRLDLAEQCMVSAEDINGLLLLYSSMGDAQGMEKLAKLAAEKGNNNVAFTCYFLLQKIEDCLNLLCNTGRIPEAAFFARTYAPSHVSRLVKLWKEDLKSVNVRAAESLADPMEYQNLFPDLQLALTAENHFKQSTLHSASDYLKKKDDLSRDLIAEVRVLEISTPTKDNHDNHDNQSPTPTPTPTPTPSPQIVPKNI